jgi:CRISPR-associated protein Cas1
VPGAERILDFSIGQARLSVRYDQLIIQRDDLPDVSTPLEEVAVAIFSSPRLSLTQSVLAGLMRAGAAVVVCDQAMLPSGLMLPLTAHFAQTQRMIAQATAPVPLKKRLWQQIVRAKVRAQAANLLSYRNDDGGLAALAATVRSGDPANVEAHAAQRYWVRLFGDGDFRRRRDAPDQNRLLNYGYAVLRAAVGRALCAAGLHPSLGVNHHHRNNPWCLADDLMEPYRPLIDAHVVAIEGEYGADIGLEPRIKERLVAALHERLDHDGEARTAFEWIERSASSLARAFLREERALFFPEGLLKP